MSTSRFLIALGCIAVLGALNACGGGDPMPSEKLAKSVVNRQCEAPVTTISQIDAELANAGLSVRSKSCAWDGLTYTASCGSPATYLRVIEIPVSQDGAARLLGYKAPSEFADFVPIECPAI